MGRALRPGMEAWDMQIEEFERLAAAYGGEIGRWPPARRDAAQVLAAQSSAARAALTEALALDRMLDASAAPQPSLALRDRILATAPSVRRVGARLGLWISGAGLAAAGVAGVLVGVAASSAAVDEVRTDALVAQVLPDEPTGGLGAWTVSRAVGGTRAG